MILRENFRSRQLFKKVFHQLPCGRWLVKQPSGEIEQGMRAQVEQPAGAHHLQRVYTFSPKLAGVAAGQPATQFVMVRALCWCGGNQVAEAGEPRPPNRPERRRYAPARAWPPWRDSHTCYRPVPARRPRRQDGIDVLDTAAQEMPSMSVLCSRYSGVPANSPRSLAKLPARGVPACAKAGRPARISSEIIGP